MPPKTTYPELKITKDTKEISFTVKVDAAAPAGIHRNIFCSVVVMENGEPVQHNLGRPPRRRCRCRTRPPRR